MKIRNGKEPKTNIFSPKLTNKQIALKPVKFELYRNRIGNLDLLVTNVIKSSGKKEPFNLEKIERSIYFAGRDTDAYGKKEAREILKKVYIVLSQVKRKVITTEGVRRIVEPIIAQAGYFETAKYYILFKERKEQSKKSDFKIWEPKMTENAKTALVSRCAKLDDGGKPCETPGQIFWRVAKHIAKAEINWGDERDVDKVAQTFFKKMVDFKFICTTSAMYEAGNEACMQQLSPCFVLKIEDSIPKIFQTLGEAALIQKNFGGTGFNFSQIRFRGDKVRNVPKAASGPVDFLQVYSAALSKIMQGSKKHGGNMGILNIDHPDVEEFIKVKDEDGNMKNFNISVGATNEFMDAVIADKKFSLKNPRDDSVVKSISAKKLFHEICEHAWKTGDPGMIFLDRMEEDNYTPTLGVLNATNPCGEQPLLPYESCNLSSLHLANHLVKKNGKWEVDWDDLGETVKTLVLFLDNMIETNKYVLPETEKMVKYGNRKIGLGVIGFGETLFKLGIAYNGPEGVRIADKVAKFIKAKAEEASLELARVRGVFPNWDISTYKGTAEKYRNCTMMTIAPTGTVSMIGDTTSGIEPSFALVYVRHSFYNEDKNNNSTRQLYYVDKNFEKVLLDRGVYSKGLIQKVAENHGSVHDLKEIPSEIRKVFVTTHDIHPQWHVKIQAAFQKYTDNAVSKTINFSNDATISDIEDAYMLAWKLGCKGITIYRDGSKEDQVLNAGSVKVAGEKVKTAESEAEFAEKECPECSGVLEFEGGCVSCKECGWSECKL
ncbi:MAG: Ribonucleoside-diphosphate reductase [Candidatus Woesebacteria bacterium GW2011_GWA1_39_21]|uniref:Vitamin B12-dependent ribonucleotide reductase n=1 Tax=Candidatus Woesebacteria bacterium GW2011_GWA1_39_21 TaxID=1618550 RepID=A0A0G0RDV7_9BACT|nr:MAG: Ribonucleoside-diphosphate reductase [Candidatus Woesebacteria bacterium GW2011_GWA1_39_21]